MSRILTIESRFKNALLIVFEALEKRLMVQPEKNKAKSKKGHTQK